MCGNDVQRTKQAVTIAAFLVKNGGKSTNCADIKFV